MKTVLLVLEQRIIDFTNISPLNPEVKSEFYFIRGMLSALYLDHVITEESYNKYHTDINNHYFGGLKK